MNTTLHLLRVGWAKYVRADKRAPKAASRTRTDIWETFTFLSVLRGSATRIRPKTEMLENSCHSEYSLKRRISRVDDGDITGSFLMRRRGDGAKVNNE